MPTVTERPVAVVCAALPVEHRSNLEHLQTEPVERQRNGSLYLLGDFEHWHIAATDVGRDNAPVSAQVERAIAQFAPKVLLFVGIAGGRRKVRHGDVVAADAVYDYQAGRDTDSGRAGRVKSLAAPFALTQRAKAVAARGQWLDRIRPGPATAPVAHIGPLASGGSVVTGGDSATARLIATHCDDALAVETEGYGVMAAGHVNPAVMTMVIRGISDLLDDKHIEADRQWQPRAARHAAAFAFELLARWRPEPTAPDTEAAAPVAAAPKYLVAQGPGAVGNVAALGDDSVGELHIHRR